MGFRRIIHVLQFICQLHASPFPDPKCAKRPNFLPKRSRSIHQMIRFKHPQRRICQPRCVKYRRESFVVVTGRC